MTINFGNSIEIKNPNQQFKKNKEKPVDLKSYIDNINKDYENPIYIPNDEDMTKSIPFFYLKTSDK